MVRRAWAFLCAASAAALWMTASCDGGNSNGDGGVDGANDVLSDVTPDAAITTCPDNLPALAWSAGPYGTHRADVSDDFSVPLTDGTTWSLKASFNGCESYVFVPDVAISDTNSASIWTQPKDLATLV